MLGCSFLPTMISLAIVFISCSFNLHYLPKFKASNAVCFRFHVVSLDPKSLPCRNREEDT